MDGLNTFAYSLALAEHYRLTIKFFLVDNQAEEFLNNLERLPENLKEFIEEARLNNALHIFSENDILKIRKELLKVKSLDAVLFANDYIKRFGHLQLFQDLFNLSVPLLLIKHDTVFRPINDLLKKTNFQDLDDQSNYDDEEENIEVMKDQKVQPSTNFKKRFKSVDKESSTSKEAAANFMMQEFNNQSSNSMIIKEKPVNVINTNADLSSFLAHKPLIAS